MLLRWCMLILLSLAVGLDLDITEYDFPLDGNNYTRYGMMGRGTGWVHKHGVGYISLPSSDDLTVTYHNSLDNYTIVHAHGLTPAQRYDGVPYVDDKPLAADATVTYHYGIQNERDGTYFLHTHYGLQHARGLAVPVVIQSPAPLHYPLEHAIANAEDVVLFLEDFCDYTPDAGPGQNPNCNNPWSTYKSLKDGWDAKAPTFNYSRCDDPADDTDVAFQYQLANGRTMDNPILVEVTPGQFIRLRIVNSGTMTSYKLNFGKLNGSVIMTDGQWVIPDTENRHSVFWIGVAQRLDILIKIPSNKGNIFPIIAQEIGNGLDPYQQAGIVLTINGAKPPSYSRNATDATGFMDVTQELTFRAWYPLKEKPVDIEFDVLLTGDSGFNSINRKSWQLPPVRSTSYQPNPNPLKVKQGQRVCINITNHNADAHSMHLHGHSFQVVQLDDHKISGAMRDTVMTSRGQCRSIKVCFDAEHPGVWPFHCHMTWHLAAGMLTTIEYMD